MEEFNLGAIERNDFDSHADVAYLDVRGIYGIKNAYQSRSLAFVYFPLGSFFFRSYACSVASNS
ncbi:MAG: hypothetical protein ACQESR_13050 [Planctomycetota bacterium]